MLIPKKKGLLIVISSPSGAGKTTITKKLVSKKLNLKLSVSLTTRKPRANEVDGVDYQFVSKNQFVNKIKKKLFLEHAKVFGNLYGTLKSEVIKNINKGKNIILDIDWQGARQIKKIIPDRIITIFILPPSLQELKKRLINRENNIYFVNQRMGKAKREITHWKEYDYAIINDDLKKCLKKIRCILDIENCKPINQIIQNFD